MTGIGTCGMVEKKKITDKLDVITGYVPLILQAGLFIVWGDNICVKIVT